MNARNHKVHSTNTSGVNGVCKRGNTGKWVAIYSWTGIDSRVHWTSKQFLTKDEAIIF